MTLASQKTGSTNQIADRTVAMDMLKDSKFFLSSLAMAATESSNDQFRMFLATGLQDAMNEHFMLSDIVVNKGWYTPSNIQQQLQNDLQNVSQSGNQQTNSQ